MELSKQQIQAKLDFAEQVNEYFPFLKGKYKILTGITIDDQGNESGSLGIEIINKTKKDGTFTLQSLLREHINKVLSDEILNQNNLLRDKNRKLRTEIKKLKSKK